ncbi:hypothetical protein HPT25_19655 [Bacillus sp. BRMEA1]|uniref:hypothetical protein n=1 Tax=Neobacillus endophyticus TaxID=2738405 RepID=UPI001563E7E7|nr:hypothetical protein [Neobacillus endophyticus]NRD79580.1 hypothetical protein [Neobacillus endophyticus]
MATLKDKFTLEDLKELEKVINHIMNQATHEKTTKFVTVSELQLLCVIDNLCQVSGLLCDLIEQQMNGHIEIFDPYQYLNHKLESTDNGIKNYLRVKKIEIE